MNKFFEFDDDLGEIKDEVVITPKEKKEQKEKVKTLFDHLKAITQKDYDKDYFNKLSESDRKTFDVYMITRFLSMNKDWVDIVNIFQKYNQVLSSEAIYKFYANIIPKSTLFLRYVKGEFQTNYNKDLIELLATYHQISTKEAREYLDVLHAIPEGIPFLEKLCSMYGKDEKETKKLLKIK